MAFLGSIGRAFGFGGGSSAGIDETERQRKKTQRLHKMQKETIELRRQAMASRGRYLRGLGKMRRRKRSKK